MGQHVIRDSVLNVNVANDVAHVTNSLSFLHKFLITISVCRPHRLKSIWRFQDSTNLELHLTASYENIEQRWFFTYLVYLKLKMLVEIYFFHISTNLMIFFFFGKLLLARVKKKIARVIDSPSMQ